MIESDESLKSNLSNSKEDTVDVKQILFKIRNSNDQR